MISKGDPELTPGPVDWPMLDGRVAAFASPTVKSAEAAQLQVRVPRPLDKGIRRPTSCEPPFDMNAGRHWLWIWDI
jgi:hypothetical protein